MTINMDKALLDSRILNDWPLWQLSSTQLEPEHIRPLPDGLNNQCYLLQLHSGSYVLRVEGKNSEALNVDRNIEFRLHRWLSENGLAPTIRYRDANKHYWIRDYVAGQALTKQDLTLSNMQRMLSYLQHVHQLTPIEGIPVISVTAKAEYFWQLIQQQTNNAELLALKAQCQSRFAGFPSADLCLCHMDPLPANWIKTDQNQLVLLDWEYAGIGHPYWDLVTLLQLVDPATEALLLQQAGIADSRAWDFAKQQMRYLSAIWYRAQALSSDEELLIQLRAALK